MPMRARSVSWQHGGRVYSTQWAIVPGGAGRGLPTETALRALGRDYFRYMTWFSPGVRVVTSADGAVEYRLCAWLPPVIAFGPPRPVQQPGAAWITYPIVGGLETATQSPVDAAVSWSSVEGDPVGPAGLLRLATRQRGQDLWLGVELEGFNPVFGPESRLYRFVVLPVHTTLSRGFVRWWLRYLSRYLERNP